VRCRFGSRVTRVTIDASARPIWDGSSPRCRRAEVGEGVRARDGVGEDELNWDCEARARDRMVERYSPIFLRHSAFLRRSRAIQKMNRSICMGWRGSKKIIATEDRLSLGRVTVQNSRAAIDDQLGASSACDRALAYYSAPYFSRT
jgi:hypothetical protein